MEHHLDDVVSDESKFKLRRKWNRNAYLWTIGQLQFAAIGYYGKYLWPNLWLSLVWLVVFIVYSTIHLFQIARRIKRLIGRHSGRAAK